MADSKALTHEIGQLKTRASEIIEAHPDGLTPSQQNDFDQVLEAIHQKQAEVDRGQKLVANQRAVAEVNDYLTKPVHKLEHGVNGDDDDQKALAKAGWEVKSGVWHKMTSLGVAQPMFPENVLSGPIPSDNPVAAQYFKTTRAAITEEYKGAYERFIRLVSRTGDPGLAMQQLSGPEQKALSEGLDTAGGFTVPVDLQADLLVRAAQQSVMRKYARVITTNRDILRYPAVAPNSTAANASIYSSGFVGGWVGETPTFSDTDLAFQSFEVAVKKLRVATRLSNDLIADSAVNILSFLSTNGAENLALVEDNGFILGDGSALQPLGILNCGLTTKDVEGHTADTVDNTTADTGSAPKLIDLVYAVPSQYVAKAVWLMRRAIEGKIRKLVDAQGRFMWPALSGSGFAGTPRMLMDYPVDNSEWMPNDGTNTNKVLLFGDLSSYIIAQRAQITSVVLRERYADSDQTGIILFERVGGACWNTDAVRLGIV